MTAGKMRVAIGLMSGTSLDGIDAAVLRTDGTTIEQTGVGIDMTYDPIFRDQLRACLGKTADQPGVADVARELTYHHAAVVGKLLDKAGLSPRQIDVIGFHGQTLLHRPERHLTVQVGDGGLLARETGIPVVSDFRSADVAAGGQGAPFAPLYHQALTEELDKPVAVLNIGGVANVTCIWGKQEDQILAFDTGPGNALIDDWVARKIDRPMDEGGRLARGGTVHQDQLAELMDTGYFQLTPPKSLDRDDFTGEAVAGLSAADGAATLVALTVNAIVRATEHFPGPVNRWLVTGGGRKNGFLMEQLALALAAPVEPVEAVGWNGDLLEAQAFAFLAVRSLNGQALSVPGTTGVPAPLTGGVLFEPRSVHL